MYSEIRMQSCYDNYKQFLKTILFTFSVYTSVTSTLEVFRNGMRHINRRFTYLLTYLHCCLGEGEVSCLTWTVYGKVVQWRTNHLTGPRLHSFLRPLTAILRLFASGNNRHSHAKSLLCILKAK